MHEYRLADVDRSVRKKNSLRLDDWVLCRIYNKKGVIEKQRSENEIRAVNDTCPPESVARLIAGSEQAVSPELTCSNGRLSNALDFPFNYVDAIADNEIVSRLLCGKQMGRLWIHLWLGRELSELSRETITVLSAVARAGLKPA
ncbi:unnamed protein product [Arabidopsis arenosa]|uniref:NAC domain-containing protein n=1 Tax=Arabidopsis arenosa TaxID=38785 RepID=A0A8S1ZQQ6_ARAAE|nr:unnamed protein product [Arabidopsis arenosa]